MRLPIFVCSVVAAVSGLFQCGGAVRSTPSGAGDAGANTSPVAALPGPSANSASGSVAGGLGGVGFGEAVTGDAGPSAIEPVSGGLVAVGSSTGTCGDAGPGIVPGLVMLASGLTCPWGMAIDATSVYWTTCGDPTGGYVLKVPKAGGEVVTLASGDRLSGIAVDATSVYWVAGTSDASSGAIMKVTVGGGTPKTLATRPGPPAHLALDDSYVYWSEQMGGAFALLRSRDLLWTPAVNSYLRGKRETPNDLMAWNADGTRMPCRMHAEYLRGLYLNNALARGEFSAEGRAVDLAAIRFPMFVVGTETDHVAPWKSVYKARGLTRSPDYTFLLTSGGHNAGIVSGPVHPRRRHRVRTWSNERDTLSPEAWLEATPSQAGSWWPIWDRWLSAHSSAAQVSPPSLGSAGAGYPPLADAPGQYVLEK